MEIIGLSQEQYYPNTGISSVDSIWKWVKYCISCNSTFIIILDNAGGIDEKIKSRIFEPYVSIKPEKNGVGLGLYNAYNTLKKSMHARIKINSEDSKTTVTIELPNP